MPLYDDIQEEMNKTQLQRMFKALGFTLLYARKDTINNISCYHIEDDKTRIGYYIVMKINELQEFDTNNPNFLYQYMLAKYPELLL
jgi:hypothetical protein